MNPHRELKPKLTPEVFVCLHGDAGNLCLSWQAEHDVISCRIQAIAYSHDHIRRGQTDRSVLDDLMGDSFMVACDAIATELYEGDR